MPPRGLRIGKITRPRVDAALPRARLFRLLDRALAPMVWIAAPPGAGKTTLASSYLAARKRPALWYALDAADADLATFFHYLSRALPGRRAALSPLTPERRLGLPVFTRRFFEELGTRLPPKAVLVFDNYHELPEGAPLGQILGMGLASLREGQRLFVLSRNPPPAELARFEASGALVRIDERELRLTFTEASAIARTRRGARSRVALRALHERTRGWVAGLVLLLEHSGAGPETPEVVFAYLAREYLEQLPIATREFLTRAALPPRVSVRMASALGGGERAHSILADLARRGAFVTRLDGPSYELHPLLRELLRAGAERDLGPDELARTTRLAASVCAEEGDAEAAAGLYAANRDWPELVELCCACAPALLAQGRHETLESWLMRLPAPARENEPWLSYWLGACRLQRAPADAHDHFVRAFDGFGRGGDRTGQIAAWSGAVDSTLFAYDDMAALDRWIAVFDELVPPGADLPPVVAPAVLASLFAALAYRQLVHPALELWIGRALKLLQSNEGDPTARMLLGYCLIGNCYWRGDVERGRLVRELMGRLVRTPSRAPFLEILRLAASAIVTSNDGDHSACRAEVDEGLSIARSSGIPLFDGYLLACAVLSTLAAHRLDEARAYLKDFEAQIQPGQRPLLLGYHSYVAAWEALASGDLPLALARARTAASVCADRGTRFPEALCQLAMAEIHVERAEAVEATRALGRARELGVGSHVVEAHARMIEAQLAFARGSEAEAERHLGDALGLARRQGVPILVSFVARPDALARLCAAALDAGIEVETVRALLRLRPAAEFTPPPSLEAWPWPVRITLCARFALEIQGKAVRFAGKAQRRPLELVQALVALGGRDVSEDALADLLWPSADGDQAQRSLGITLHRLRALLGDASLVRRQAGLLTLDTARVFADVWAVEHLLLRARQTKSKEAKRLVGRALALYRGPFLPAQPAAWAASTRTRLATRVAHAATGVGSTLDSDAEG